MKIGVIFGNTGSILTLDETDLQFQRTFRDELLQDKFELNPDDLLLRIALTQCFDSENTHSDLKVV
mgnify:CR=1 FL=1